MDFNQYSAYSIISANEAIKKEDIAKVLNIFEDLRKFNTEREVRNWLKTNWNVEDGINHISISDYTTISLTNGQNYFNLTLQNENKVKTYNYLKERRV